MKTIRQRIDFEANDIDVESFVPSIPDETNGSDESDLDLSDGLTTNTDFSNFAVSGQFVSDIETGIAVDIQNPSLGSFDFSYPLSTTVTTANEPRPGETFTVNVGNSFSVGGATFTAETFNFNRAVFDLFIDSPNQGSAASFTNLDILGLSDEKSSTIGDALTVGNFDRVSTEILTIDPDIAAGVEPVEGLNFSTNFRPDGNAATFTQDGVAENKFPEIGGDAGATLASINVNPIQFAASVPVARRTPIASVADSLSGDVGPINLPGGLEVSAGLNLFQASLGAGIDLVQDFTFDPKNVNVTVEIGDEQKRGSLGDQFNFTLPENGDIPDTGSISYELEGAADLTLGLEPSGSFGLEAGGASLKIGDDLSGDRGGSGAFLDLSLGPIVSHNQGGSLDSGRVDLVTPLENAEVDSSQIPTVTKQFELDDTGAESGSEGEDDNANGSGAPTDLVFVLDVTGSMSDDIAQVREQSRRILDSLFTGDENNPVNRAAVVSFRDSSVVPQVGFTEQDTVTARREAIENALDSFGTGGEIEPVNEALLTALDGGVGQWREDAARRVVLFGDEPPDDPELADEVRELASQVDARVESEPQTQQLSDRLARTDLTFRAQSEGEGDSVEVPVQIFTVRVGDDLDARAAFDSIAENTGGEAFNAASADEVVNTLLDAINEPGQATVGDGVLGVPEGIGTRSLLGTDGNDTVTITSHADAGAAFAHGRAGDDSLHGLGRAETIFGGAGDDTIEGGDAADTLFGNAGKDEIAGGAGNDILIGNTGSDILQGNEGSDEIHGSEGRDILTGGSGSDRFVFGRDAGNDVVTDFENRNGDTLVFKNISNVETLNTQEQDGGVVIDHEGGTVAVVGADAEGVANGIVAGTSSLRANIGETSGADSGRMGASEDGSLGDDVQNNPVATSDVAGRVVETDDDVALNGGRLPASDVFIGGSDTDLKGGRGPDVVIGGGNSAGGSGGDLVVGSDNGDQLSGGNGADEIHGLAGPDEINGDMGSDVLTGGDGGDVLAGGRDSDVLVGGVGNDTLSGGPGADVFRFDQTSGTELGTDIITDFDSADGDVVELNVSDERTDLQTLLDTGRLVVNSTTSGATVETNQVSIELPGVTDSADADDLIGLV